VPAILSYGVLFIFYCIYYTSRSIIVLTVAALELCGNFAEFHLFSYYLHFLASLFQSGFAQLCCCWIYIFPLVVCIEHFYFQYFFVQRAGFRKKIEHLWPTSSSISSLTLWLGVVVLSRLRMRMSYC
jgi:hypothetical protein